jgi:beta-N-acetylhexosaminidase
MKAIAQIFLFCLVFGGFSESSAKPALSLSDSDSLAFKVGQMLMVGFRGLNLTDNLHISEDLTKRHIGGVILFDYDVPSQKPVRNIESKSQLKALIQALKSKSSVPLLVAVDQEGGRVQRLKPKFGFSALPSHEMMGNINNADSTLQVAEVMAKELKEMGFNLNFAPVIDLNSNPQNPVIGKLGRSFSAKPELVIKHSRIFLKALRQKQIFAAIKHFPGHGSSMSDSHLGVADVTQTWDKEELKPYKVLSSEGKVDMVMTAHIFNKTLDPSYPATLSKTILQSYLRKDCGFNGVIISDDLQMKAISDHYGLEETLRLSINAGVDVLLFANNSVYDPHIAKKAQSMIISLVKSGKISISTINRAYRRIMQLKKDLR